MNKTTHNFSYPSRSTAVVFGVHLSAQAAFRLERKVPAILNLFILSNVVDILTRR
jgi:hypothetical protein